MKRRAIWTVDCETDPFKSGRIPKPFIWGIYTGSEFHTFKTTPEMLEFLTAHNVIAYAHNGGKFDWHFFIDKIPNKTSVMIINGRIAKFKIGLCEFRDSYNILPFALKNYKKDEIDYSLLEPELREIPENKNKIIDYLKGDCVYLHEMVTDYVARFGLKLTLASAALNQWKKIHKTTAPRTNAAFYNELKPFYSGGRVECFKKGIIKQDFNILDINSAYPYAMIHAHPYGDSFMVDNELPDNYDQCFINLTAKSTGVFAFRDKTGLHFPNDGIIREFNVTGWEYRAALEMERLEVATIKKVYHFYERVEFTKYIDHFFNLKSESDKIGDKKGYIAAKLMLNALYGKFGSNPTAYKNYVFDEIGEIEGWEPHAIINGKMIHSRPLAESDQRFYNVAVAASVTGFVRAYLARAIFSAKNVLYCDTDSLVCESATVPTGSQLGAWKLEGMGNYGGIAGKKLYAFKMHKPNETKEFWKMASKGAKLTKEQVMAIAAGESITYDPIAPTFSVKSEPRFISRIIRAT
jgi:hypothetical protein